MLILLALALAAALCAADAPPGWRMVDRFHGFRYDCEGRFDRDAWMLAIRDEADELSGFGWVQVTAAGHIVGEFRGSRQTGPLMAEFLRDGPEDALEYKCSLKDYADTKIRLHFSHFKILDRRRETCFLEPPHQCEPRPSPASAARDEL